MSRKYSDDLDRMFNERADHLKIRDEWNAKFFRFLRYLSTRKMECWGFFVAGFLIATIF